MKPLNYRPFGVRVTDLASQLWCEKQVEFSLKFGRKKTKAMKSGGKIHDALHKEVAVLIEVTPKTFEDVISLKLHNMLSGIRALITDNITREVPVYGNVGSVFVSGQIDEILISDGKAYIKETKTRLKDSRPTDEQVKTAEFQLMLYRSFLESMKRGDFSPKHVMDFFEMKPDSVISRDFRKETASKGLLMNPLVGGLCEEIFDSVRKIPDISDKMSIEYRSQRTGEPIFSHYFTFDRSDFDSICESATSFWTGERPAAKTKDSWKCSFCEFRGRCMGANESLITKFPKYDKNDSEVQCYGRQIKNDGRPLQAQG